MNKELAERVLEAMERINQTYRKQPGFASNVGANHFDYALEDLRKAIATEAA